MRLVLQGFRCGALLGAFRVVSPASAKVNVPVARAALLSAQSWDWIGSEVNPRTPSVQLRNRVSRKQEPRTGDKRGWGLGGEMGESLLP